MCLDRTTGATAAPPPAESRNRASFKGTARTAAAALAAMAGLLAAADRPAHAQSGVLDRGDAVTTGFPGIRPSSTPVPPGQNPLDYFELDAEGPAAQILSLRDLAGPPQGQLAGAPPRLQLKARDIGLVFAIALDDGERGSQTPAIYLGQSAAYGLHIVDPNGAGPGLAKRLVQGKAGAQWMAGQLGPATAPGTIWRVDGMTGEAVALSRLPSNSGPGIGDIAFDARGRHLYVSDLDTGLVHRVALDGRLIDTFDHGIAGRPQRALPAVADDGRLADITSAAFVSTSPATWGFTQPERRVGGMTVRDGRLFYALAEGPQVWSIGLNADGSFAGDARWELDVTGRPGSGEITDILFDGEGRMVLAERGAQRAAYDFSIYAEPGKSAVLRYRLESPDDPATPGRWVPVPDEYAISLPVEHRFAAGGIALGYGHDASGRLQGSRCNVMVWSTGDRLRPSGALESGINDVHGLQGNDLALVRPENVPPMQSYFVDYDGLFGDAEKAGHVGDVEIWQPCGGTDFAQLPPGQLPPGYLPPGVVPPGFPPEFPPPGTPYSTNLKLTKRALVDTCLPWGGGWACFWRVFVQNTGPDAYFAPILVDDWLPAVPAGAVMGFGAAPWNCWATGPAAYRCWRPLTFLAPGASVSFNAWSWVPAAYPFCHIQNAATIVWAPGGSAWNTNPGDDTDGAVAAIPAPHCPPPGGPTNLVLRKIAVPDSCLLGAFTDATCAFRVTALNAGPGVYNGPLTIRDEPMAGTASVGFGPMPPWACVAAGAGFDCTQAAVTLNPGEATILNVTMTVPRNTVTNNGCKIDNRARILFAPGGSPQNTNPADDQSSASANIADAKFCQPIAEAVGCPPGFALDKGQCVSKQQPPPARPPLTPPVAQPKCPEGTTGNYPNCRQIVTPVCPQGTTGIYPNCRQIVIPKCPQGTSGIYPNCRPIVLPKCPQGTTGTFPNCRQIVTPQCPTGTTGKFPDCRPIVQQKCPQGTIGIFPNCRKVTVQTCPKGTIGIYPNCKRLQVVPLNPNLKVPSPQSGPSTIGPNQSAPRSKQIN